jgi:HemK-related putative methylase
MKKTEINGIGEVMVLDEFLDIYNSAVKTEICHTTINPTSLFEKIRNNIAVIISGDYRQAEYLLHYLHHYESALVTADDIRHYQSTGIKNHAAIKRIKKQRFMYLLHKNTFLLLEDSPFHEDIQSWLSEDVQEHRYLLPARRYNRILTDLKRARDGIYFDFINAALYIKPFVYVPFDKSVPEMFFAYACLFKGKRVIDIGTGTGILAMIAAKTGAEDVVAVDINPNAVSCVQNNIKANKLEHVISKVICTDLFDGINDTFDVILFNAPWIKGKPKNAYETAIYDPNFTVINRFFQQAGAHLENEGVILLQYSDISQANGDGSLDNLYMLLEKFSFYIADQTSILRKNRLFGMMERVYVFALKKLIQKETTL